MNTGPALFAICMVGIAIAFGFPAEPGETEPAPESTPKSAVAAVVAAPAKAPASQWSEGISLPRAGDGHFYAEVQIDMAPTLMLVDTGASTIALTEDDALAAGLYWNEADLTTVAQGASGPVRGVRVTLPQVSLGGIEARDVPAIVVPEGLPISLLGQSFLSQVRTVAIEGDSMVLSQ